MQANWKQPRLHLKKGKRAETAALRYLTLRGLRCIERNFLCRGGEIDLIMQTRSLRSAKTLVFVEVRYRSQGLEAALLSINQEKIRKVSFAANVYLAKYPQLIRQPCRFDVVTVTRNHGWHRCRWLKDAWQLDNL